jgi:hypothetical protein
MIIIHLIDVVTLTLPQHLATAPHTTRVDKPGEKGKIVDMPGLLRLGERRRRLKWRGLPHQTRKVEAAHMYVRASIFFYLLAKEK